MKNSKRDRFLFCRMTSCFDCEPCKEDCIKKLTVNKGINNISIQEAINIMAKAIMDEFFLSSEGSKDIAEAALKALLEGGKL